MVYAVRIVHLILRVDQQIVFVHGQPWGTGGESGVLLRVPLHRRPGVIPGNPGEIPQHILRVHQAGFHPLAPGVVHFHILVLVHVREVNVGHAQFLALINIGRAPHHVDHCGQHLRAAGPEQFAVIAVAADLARLVVVPKVDRIPGFSLQRSLPAVERRAHILQRRAVIAPLPEFSSVVQSVVMLKGEDHIQFRSILVRIANRAVRGSAGLADGQQIILVQHLAPHLPEIAMRCFRMHARGAEIAIQRSGRHRTVVEILLADHADDVHPPSVHAFVAPPAHHLKHAFPDFGICPVQIRLFFCE